MELAFTKGSGKMDRLRVTHGDGRTEDIDCPKQRIVPHDMVHFAVERVAAHRGFLTMVREGEGLAYVTLGDAEAESVERLVEAFQALLWSGGGSDADIVYAYATACAARGNPQLPVAEADIAAIRDELHRLGAQWDALPVGGTLHLRF